MLSTTLVRERQGDVSRLPDPAKCGVVVGVTWPIAYPPRDTSAHYEYLLAHFGSWAPANEALPVLLADPAEACQPLLHDVDGAVVMVQRGAFSGVSST